MPDKVNQVMVRATYFERCKMTFLPFLIFLYVVIQASLLSIASDSTQTSSSSTDPTTVDPFDYSNDDYSKVKGPEKEGIYGVLEGCQLQKLHHLLLIQQQWDK